MKRIFLVILIGWLSVANAQFRPNNNRNYNREFTDNQKFSYGFFLSGNYFNFKVHPNNNGTNEYERFYLRVEPQPGFSVGMMGKMRLTDNFDLKLEPTMHFVTRDLFFTNIQGETDSTRNVKSTYLDIPLMLKFHGDRWFNTRPYMQAGIGWATNLQSQEKKEEDNADGIFRMKTQNFNWQVEAGVEIYFKKFKLTPAFKGIFFFNNELVADNVGTNAQWANSIRSISTRAWMFSLKFE